MKSTLTKSQASQKIELFFKNTEFTPKELKKIKRLAMKYRISLKNLRKKFCKSCLYPLKGKTRVTKTSKTVICQSCGFKNKFVLKT
jgi:RNase P subunit RPR2